MTSNETKKTKKAMTPAELVEYATGQIKKAEGEGDKAGPRLDALRDVLASAVDVLKQSAGGAEDLESARIQVEVYQETGLTSVPEEKEIPVSDLQAGGSIDELLAKVEKLCGELGKAENLARGPGGQGLGPGGVCTCPKCGAEVKHETGKGCVDEVCPKCGAKMARPVDKAWPADMNTPADKADMKKNDAGSDSWGPDPVEVRGPAS